MKNFDVKIFETHFDNEGFNRIKEELNKNPNFVINDDNITDFVDCGFLLETLRKQKIEYKIIVKDRWTTEGRIPQYDLLIGIYISQKDYVLIKHLFEPDNKVKYDMENDKITKNVNLTNNILINLMCFAIAIPLLVLGVQLIIDDIITSLLFIIIGGGILIYRISKISKSIINKFTKRL